MASSFLNSVPKFGSTSSIKFPFCCKTKAWRKQKRRLEMFRKTNKIVSTSIQTMRDYNSSQSRKRPRHKEMTNAKGEKMKQNGKWKWSWCCHYVMSIRLTFITLLLGWLLLLSLSLHLPLSLSIYLSLSLTLAHPLSPSLPPSPQWKQLDQVKQTNFRKSDLVSNYYLDLTHAKNKKKKLTYPI